MQTVPAARRRAVLGEAGFTIVEISITMMLAAIVSTALLSMLTSQSNAEARITKFANNQEQARLAVVAMQRDLRASEPLVALPTADEYKYRVDLELYDSPTDTTIDLISWRVVTVAGADQLQRQLVLPDKTVHITHRLLGVSNRSVPQPLFTYWDAKGIQFVPSEGETPDTIARCTMRVRIDLRAAPEAGPAPARLLSDVQLRNRLRGGAGC